jgi:hypothetical protein
MSDIDQLEEYRKRQKALKASQSPTNWPLIIGIIVGTIFVIGIIVLTFFLYRKNTIPIVQTKDSASSGPYYMTYKTPSTYQPVKRGFAVATPEDIRNIRTPSILNQDDYVQKLYETMKSQNKK